MKHILLPTDFSENSKNAILYAMELFRGNTCEFYFLNVQKPSEFVLDDVMSAEPGTSVYQAILKDNKQQLKEFIIPIKEKYQTEDYTFLLYVDYDVLTDSINQLKQTKTIDLIVMGTNGATGAEEVLFGSNTLKVIRKVDSPLLAIPQDYTYKKIESVVFTARSCKDIKHEAAQPLKELVKLTNAQLQILKIKGQAAKNNHNCGSCLVDAMNGFDYESHTLYGIPEPIAIDTFVQLMKSGLHAMFVERETFLDRFFFGNNTAKISYSTRVPLLVLHK